MVYKKRTKKLPHHLRKIGKKQSGKDKNEKNRRSRGRPKSSKNSKSADVNAQSIIDAPSVAESPVATPPMLKPPEEKILSDYEKKLFFPFIPIPAGSDEFHARKFNKSFSRLEKFVGMLKAR